MALRPPKAPKQLQQTERDVNPALPLFGGVRGPTLARQGSLQGQGSNSVVERTPLLFPLFINRPQGLPRPKRASSTKQQNGTNTKVLGSRARNNNTNRNNRHVRSRQDSGAVSMNWSPAPAPRARASASNNNRRNVTPMDWEPAPAARTTRNRTNANNTNTNNTRTATKVPSRFSNATRARHAGAGNTDKNIAMSIIKRFASAVPPHITFTNRDGSIGREGIGPNN